MFQFEQAIYLYLLVAVPFLWLLFLYGRYKTRKTIEKYGDKHVVSQLFISRSRFRPSVKMLLILPALALIIIALAQPQSGAKMREVKREGVEILIALDVSNSMLAEDISPNRLTRAKRAVSGLIDRLGTDKFGMIVFAGDAYTQIPITSDYSAAKMFLSSISTQTIAKQGTNIGSAIERAMKSFTPDDESSKVLIIITDGEDHDQAAIEAAKEAAEKGIIVHTIGMGLPKGGPIPQGNDYRRDQQGNIVLTKLNETMLTDVARAGNGIYIRANNTQVGLNALFDEINKLEKAGFGMHEFSEYEDQFPYFAGFALLLLLIDMFILERKNKRLAKLSLFNEKQKQ